MSSLQKPKIQMLKLDANKIFPYKSKKSFPAGEYVLFTSKDESSLMWKILQPKYCTDIHLNKVGWVAPLKFWVKKLFAIKDTAVKPSKVHLSDKQIEEVYNLELSTRRKWQAEVLKDIAEAVYTFGRVSRGIIAPLGAGKCLFGLDVCQLGEKAIYLAPTYLHGQIRQEAVKFNRVYPVISTYESAHHFQSEVWDVVVGDECTKIKNPDSERTKKFRMLVKNATVAVGLTGTPSSSKEALDARWINSFVEDSLPESEDSIKYLFGLNPEEQNLSFPMGSDDDGNVIMGSKKNIVVQGWDSSTLAKFLSDEVYAVDVSSLYAEIPGIQYHTIELETPKHFKLAQKGLFTKDDSESKALAQARQVTSGFYYTDDGSAKRVNTIKIDCIERWLDDNEAESVLIYSNFKESQLMLCDQLARYNPARVLSSEGENVAQEIDRFKNKETRVMVATTAFAYGMNLMDVCSNMFFESLPTSSELYQQAIGRIYRPGQQKFVNVYFLQCENTLDGPAKDLLSKHANVSEAIMKEVLLNEFRKLNQKTAGPNRRIITDENS